MYKNININSYLSSVGHFVSHFVRLMYGNNEEAVERCEQCERNKCSNHWCEHVKYVFVVFIATQVRHSNVANLQSTKIIIFVKNAFRNSLPSNTNQMTILRRQQFHCDNHRRLLLAEDKWNLRVMRLQPSWKAHTKHYRLLEHMVHRWACFEIC